MIASLIQMVFGLTGIVGHLLKFVGPLTVIPTIVLVGLPLFQTAYNYSSKYNFRLSYPYSIYHITFVIHHDAKFRSSTDLLFTAVFIRKIISKEFFAKTSY